MVSYGNGGPQARPTRSQEPQRLPPTCPQTHVLTSRSYRRGGGRRSTEGSGLTPQSFLQRHKVPSLCTDGRSSGSEARVSQPASRVYP